MMKSFTLKDFLISSTPPPLGSFGEHVFCHYARLKYNDIESYHVELCDFIVNGKKVDVKTSAKFINSELVSDLKWQGERVQGVNYAKVDFYRDGARISLESEIIENVSWPNLEKIYDAWRSKDYKRKLPSKARQSKCQSIEIKNRVKNIFSTANISEPYILYRTVMFSGESPHNLLPSQRGLKGKKGWSVFLIFKKAPPRIDNLDKIIAFPDSVDSSLPRLQKIRTGRHIPNLEKADLSKIPSKYKFANLDSLERHLRGNT